MTPNLETACWLAHALWRHTKGTPENAIVEAAWGALKLACDAGEVEPVRRYCTESCESCVPTNWACASSLAYAMWWHTRGTPENKLAQGAWLAVGKARERKACEPEPREQYEIVRESVVSYAELPRDVQLMLELSGAATSFYIGSYNARGDLMILRAQEQDGARKPRQSSTLTIHVA